MSAAADHDAGAEERRPLCDAMVDLVLEVGYPQLDAAAVSRRAGAPAGVFERHFSDLDECFGAAWDGLAGAYLERLESAYRDESEWRDKFRAAAWETARLAEAHPRAARFLAVAALSAGALGQARQRRLGRHLVALIDTAREQVEDPDAVPAITARWIALLFFDRIYRRFTSPGGPDLVSQVPELMFLAVTPFFGVRAGLAELDRRP